mmetsp:Transcript_12765/g.35315  ORF Transcript_12765/g.35315 Transcript_12765/m.35315 type:complete len:244 (+) Transcript_12765:104-835(+)
MTLKDAAFAFAFVFGVSLSCRGASLAATLCDGSTALCSYLLYAGLCIGVVMAMMASWNSGSRDRFPTCRDMNLRTRTSTVVLPTVWRAAFDSATALGAHSERRPQTYSRCSCFASSPFRILVTRPNALASSEVFLAPVRKSSSRASRPVLSATNSPPSCAPRPAKQNSAELAAATASKVLQSARPYPETVPFTSPKTYIGSIQKRKSICWNSSSCEGRDSSRPAQKQSPLASTQTRRTFPTLR